MNKEVTSIITKVLTDQSVEFDVQRRRYRLYPSSLGKVFLTAPLIESLGINKENVTAVPFLEILRIVQQHRDACCRIIAYHTLRGKQEVLNLKAVKAQEQRIANSFDDDDIGTILIAILKDNSINEIIKATQMDREAEKMASVNTAKNHKNTFVFGGKSIWGSLIDAACERYGWTFDYVVWGISYANLTLMLKDKITSVFLTDDERKRVRLPDYSGDIISGDDKKEVLRLAMESEAKPN